MLRVDLGALNRGPVEVAGTVEPEDPAFEGVEIDLRSPARATGRITAAGDGRYYWHGTVSATLGGDCRRCLRPVATEINADVHVIFQEDGDDPTDPDVYQVPSRTSHLDLVPVVRDELVLGAPAFVVCRDDCAGLCSRCGKDLNAGPCDCAKPADPRWDALKPLDIASSGKEE